MIRSKKGILFVMFLLGCLSIGISQQLLNKEIKAIIEVKNSEDFFTAYAKSENLSKINRSLLYEFKVFKEGQDKNGNKSNSKQSGRFVIEAKKIKELSSVSISVTDKEKIILLLVIKNLDGNIKERIES